MILWDLSVCKVKKCKVCYSNVVLTQLNEFCPEILGVSSPVTIAFSSKGFTKNHPELMPNKWHKGWNPPKNGGVRLFDNSFAEILVEQVGILGTNVVMLESHDLY